MSEMTAEQIKKAIINKSTQKPKPIEEAQILGIKGWLFRCSSYAMEGWRDLANDKDASKRRLGPAKLIQISFCSEDGTPVFEELDIPIIAGIEDSEISPIIKRILVINGFGNEGIDEILKNLIAIAGIDGVYAALASINAPCPNCSKRIMPTNYESNTSANNIGRREQQPKSSEPSSSA